MKIITKRPKSLKLIREIPQGTVFSGRIAGSTGEHCDTVDTYFCYFRGICSLTNGSNWQPRGDNFAAWSVEIIDYIVHKNATLELEPESE